MPRKILAFISIISLFSLFALLVQLKPKILKINHVVCQLDGEICPSELTQQLATIEGKSLLFSLLETHILELNLNLYQFKSMTKTWPDAVSLNFSRKPNSYIVKINPENTLLVSENGLTQPISIEQNLPLIEIISWTNPIQEDVVEEKLHHLNLSLIRFLATREISYKNIKIRSPQEIEILLPNNLTAIAQRDDLEKQITKLSIILNELDLNSVDLQINKIDLRFKFPLLKS